MRAATRCSTPPWWCSPPTKSCGPTNRASSGRRGPIRTASYRVTALPGPEAYLMVAVQGLEDGQAGDPEFLATIRDSATKFDLGEGETKAVDVKLLSRRVSEAAHEHVCKQCAESFPKNQPFDVFEFRRHKMHAGRSGRHDALRHDRRWRHVLLAQVPDATFSTHATSPACSISADSGRRCRKKENSNGFATDPGVGSRLPTRNSRSASRPLLARRAAAAAGCDRCNGRIISTSCVGVDATTFICGGTNPCGHQPLISGRRSLGWRASITCSIAPSRAPDGSRSPHSSIVQRPSCFAAHQVGDRLMALFDDQELGVAHADRRQAR